MTEPLRIEAPRGDRYDEVLTERALRLVGRLHEELDSRRQQLLNARLELQAELDAGPRRARWSSTR